MVIWRLRGVFYNKYLDYDNLIELYQNYAIDYLANIDEFNFSKVYDLFRKYKFNYIEDIIIKYLDVFEMNYRVVYDKINKLIKVLGTNYVDIIGEDMSYLEYIIRD